MEGSAAATEEEREGEGLTEEEAVELLQVENETRERCEARFNEERLQRPAQLVWRMFSCATNASLTSELRRLAGMMMKRALMKEVDWPDEQEPARLRTAVLEAVSKETNLAVSRVLCDTVVALATEVLGDDNDVNQWPDLLPFLFRCAKSPEWLQRLAALHVMTELSAICPAPFHVHLPLIMNFLKTCLGDENCTIQCEAARATFMFAESFERPEEVLLFQQLLPSALECTQRTMRNGRMEDTEKILSELLDLIEIRASTLRESFDLILPSMCTWADPTTTGITADIKRQAVEALVLLCEQLPAAVKKHAEFMVKVIPLVLSCISTLDDDDGWYNFASECSERDDDPTMSELAEENLDRLCNALGAKVLPVLLPWVHEHANDAGHWKNRYAAVMAMSICATGCNAVLKKDRRGFREHLSFVERMASDEHPRVRWAAINCLGQWCFDFAPEVEKHYGGELIPFALEKSHDTCLRVQTHCCVLLMNFAEAAEVASIPELPAVVSRLLELVQSQTQKVVEITVGCLASVAVCADQNFKQFYDVVVPVLKAILEKSHTDSDNPKSGRILHDRIIEGLTLIGLAVGKQKFFADAHYIIHEMLKSSTVPEDTNSLARLAEILGKDFTPVLKLVVEASLTRASVKITDLFAADTLADAFAVSPEVMKKVEQKETALQTLLTYADATREGFVPYVPQVADVAVSFLDDADAYSPESARVLAACIPPVLLACVADSLRATDSTVAFMCGFHQRCGLNSKLRVLNASHARDIAHTLRDGVDTTPLVELFQKLCPYLIPSTTAVEEGSLELASSQLSALSECLDNIHRECMPQNQVDKFFLRTMAVLQTVWQLQTQRNDESYEPQELCDLITAAVTALGKVGKYHTDAYKAFFPILLQPEALKMIASRDTTTRQQGVILLDDYVEALRQRAGAELPELMRQFLAAVSDDVPNVRQAAAYGIGITAQFLGDAFAPYVKESVTKLLEAAKLPDPRCHENADCSDNVISALMRVARYQCTFQNLIALPEL
eukprot:TRINITY_DN1963_c0_g1_i1.p1 TRINITY_DN1963_c0_g1~~TRINITY_DN1963_c0_g1_i1.p1  ORF type:complete len:1016 (+),score=218.80 TRINITY_DN1963_c0_g1_i1:14-3061(+)